MSFQLDYFEASAIIAHGELQPEDLPTFRKAIKQFVDGRYTIKVEKETRRRSHAQNRYWWATVVKAFSDHCGYYPDEMHEILKLQLLPKQVEWTDPTTGEIEELTIGTSTASLTTAEFKQLIERAQHLGAELGIVIPDPATVGA